MLVLSRKPQQSIVIGDDIMITVVEMGRGRVQIGVRAPGYIPIYREEIVRRMIEAGEIEDLPCFQVEERVVEVGERVFLNRVACDALKCALSRQRL